MINGTPKVMCLAVDTHRLVADIDTALEQQVFDLAQR